MGGREVTTGSSQAAEGLGFYTEKLGSNTKSKPAVPGKMARR